MVLLQEGGVSVLLFPWFYPTHEHNSPEAANCAASGTNRWARGAISDWGIHNNGLRYGVGRHVADGRFVSSVVGWWGEAGCLTLCFPTAEAMSRPHSSNA
jgi:hypothetical protein